LDHIRSRVAGEIALKEILAQFDPREKKHRDSVEEHEAKLPLDVKLATALFEAGKITEAEYFFHCGFYIVDLHERYLTDGIYDPELKEICAAMEKIQRRHGLKDNEYWLISDAPMDYLHESKKYDSVLEKKQIEVFRRFCLHYLPIDWKRIQKSSGFCTTEADAPYLRKMIISGQSST
jgi:hypothetical protein